MAEDFLEEIYQKAKVIDQIRYYIDMVRTGRDRDARAAYNLAAAAIERILPELSEEDRELAAAIEDAAIRVRDSFNDQCEATALAEGLLIPLLFEYMSYYTGIDVTEGKYTIQSANSGFLSVKDEEQRITMHSSYDPMGEAYGIAGSVFSPSTETYHILGCGLGYLPYQIWRMSEGAASIVIYEEDEVMLIYARQYGVLSWIEDSALKIYHNPDIDKVADMFLAAEGENVSHNRKEYFYISAWKKNIYKNARKGAMSILEANIALQRSMSSRTDINIWKNAKHERITLDAIKAELKRDEWIVVSAGPSLDEQMDFLKQSMGVRGIVAVNTVLRRLFKEGIRPDLVAAADQYVQMREHIAGIGDQTEGIPLIAERRLNWQYLEQYCGPVCLVDAGYEAAISNKGEDTDVWQVSGSVAGLALEAAVRMGAKKIWLVGQDLAYPSGKTYAEGMPYKADVDERGTMTVSSVDGGTVRTSEAFNWFRLGLESQLARYKGIEVFNMSKHGALIKGAKSVLSDAQ